MAQRDVDLVISNIAKLLGLPEDTPMQDFPLAITTAQPVYDEHLVDAASVLIEDLDGDADGSYSFEIEGTAVIPDGSLGQRRIMVRPNDVAIVPGTNSVLGMYDDGGSAQGTEHLPRLWSGEGLVLASIHWANLGGSADVFGTGRLQARTGGVRRRLWRSSYITGRSLDNSMHYDGRCGGYWYDAVTPLASLRIDFGGTAFTGRLIVRTP